MEDVFQLTVEVDPVVDVFAVDNPAPVTRMETPDDGESQTAVAVKTLEDIGDDSASAFFIPSDSQIMQQMSSEDYDGTIQIGSAETLHTGSLTPDEVIEAIHALGGVESLAGQAENFGGHVGIDHASSGFEFTHGYIITG